MPDKKGRRINTASFPFSAFCLFCPLHLSLPYMARITITTTPQSIPPTGNVLQHFSHISKPSPAIRKIIVANIMMHPLTASISRSALFLGLSFANSV